MVPYAVNGKDRSRVLVYFILSAAAIGTWFGIKCVLSKFGGLIPENILERIPVPTGLTFYFLFLLLFDHQLWRRRPVRWLLRIPNLNGEWDGVRKREKDGQMVESQFWVDISQTWSHIRVTTHNERTISDATSAAFLRSDKGEVEFMFTCISTPQVVVPKGENLQPWATQRWRVIDGGRKLQGTYYSTNTLSGQEALERRT